jgi:hypothetical protein
MMSPLFSPFALSRPKRGFGRIEGRAITVLRYAVSLCSPATQDERKYA